MNEFSSPLVSNLTAGLHNKEELKNLSKFHSKDLKVPTGENPWAFLWALCGVESSYGFRNVPRFEPAYGPGGIYYQKSQVIRSEYEKYGALVSCSYGPWQIMYNTAFEMGYRRHPLDLWCAFISLPYVVEYLNDARKRGAMTLEQMAWTYNGGGGALKKQSERVKKYGMKVLAEYDRFKGQLIDQ